MSVPLINSKTEICNIALSMVGAERIEAYEDTVDKNSRLCRDHYDLVRDQLLRSALWSFATTRATLSQYASAPSFGESYQYELPADYLRMISLNDTIAEGGVDDFRIEMVGTHKVLVTEEDVAHIRYIYRNDTPANYDPVFIRAFATTLASHLAVQLCGDYRVAESLAIRAERDVAKAMHENANETKQVIKSVINDAGLVRARISSALG